MPSIMMDVNYTHSFNNPNDNTVVGSTALARDNEIQLSSLNFGGILVFKCPGTIYDPVWDPFDRCSTK